MTTKHNHCFIVMWDCQGLECCFDITQDEKDRTWNALQGRPHTSSVPNLMHLELRARYNSQRHYEIWAVNAAPGITRDDIVEMFENDPNTAAEIIRARGKCFYSDRANPTQPKIT